MSLCSDRIGKAKAGISDTPKGVAPDFAPHSPLPLSAFVYHQPRAVAFTRNQYTQSGE
jgi:hypothetical protein